MALLLLFLLQFNLLLISHLVKFVLPFFWLSVAFLSLLLEIRERESEPSFFFIQGFAHHLFDKRSQRKLSWEIVLLFTGIPLFSGKVGQFSPRIFLLLSLCFSFSFPPLFYNSWDASNDAKSHQFSLKWTVLEGMIAFKQTWRNTFCHIMC